MMPPPGLKKKNRERKNLAENPLSNFSNIILALQDFIITGNYSKNLIK